MSFIFYNPVLKERARSLRNNSTQAEIKLWKCLRRDQLGCDFHRQKPIGNYVVDFFCPKFKLAIEIDGISHLNKANYDKKRQADLEIIGIKVLKFTDEEVNKNIETVLEVIKNFIVDNTSLYPSSRRETEGTYPSSRRETEGTYPSSRRETEGTYPSSRRGE